LNSCPQNCDKRGQSAHRGECEGSAKSADQNPPEKGRIVGYEFFQPTRFFLFVTATRRENYFVICRSCREAPDVQSAARSVQKMLGSVQRARFDGEKEAHVRFVCKSVFFAPTKLILDSSDEDDFEEVDLKEGYEEKVQDELLASIIASKAEKAKQLEEKKRTEHLKKPETAQKSKNIVAKAPKEKMPTSIEDWEKRTMCLPPVIIR
jgi:hypothetical protein